MYCVLLEGRVRDRKILAREIPCTEKPGRLQPLGSQRVRHNLATEHTPTQVLGGLGVFMLTWPHFVIHCGWGLQLNTQIVGLWRKLSSKELMLLNCGVGEDSWESLGLQGDPASLFWRRSALGFLWKEWCWSWNSSTWATSCEELTHWKRLWCWEGLGAREEGDNRGWDGWMASLTRWTWIWVNSGSWWWTGRPGVLRFRGSQRVGHDWATELNWTESANLPGASLMAQW